MTENDRQSVKSQIRLQRNSFQSINETKEVSKRKVSRSCLLLSKHEMCREYGLTWVAQVNKSLARGTQTIYNRFCKRGKSGRERALGIDCEGEDERKSSGWDKQSQTSCRTPSSSSSQSLRTHVKNARKARVWRTRLEQQVIVKEQTVCQDRHHEYHSSILDKTMSLSLIQPRSESDTKSGLSSINKTPVKRSWRRKREPVALMNNNTNLILHQKLNERSEGRTRFAWLLLYCLFDSTAAIPGPWILLL